MKTSKFLLRGFWLLLLTFFLSYQGFSQFDFSLEQESCNSWLLSIDDAPIPDDLVFLTDDVTITQTDEGYLITLPEGGSAIVCVTLPGLMDLPLYCHDFVADCDNCPSGLISTVDGCFVWLEFTTGTEASNFIWDFGDGNVSTSMDFPYVQHIYNEPGWYNVLVTYESEECNQQTYSTEVLVENCNDNCWIDIDFLEVTCDYVFASAWTEDPNAYIWWWINGEWYDGEVITLYDLEPGTYELCAVMESPSCPWATEACTTVVVEDCQPCVGQFYAEDYGCEAQLFVEGAPNDAEITWEWNGNVVNSTNQGYWIETQQPGWYTVCWSYTSESCSEVVQGCGEFYSQGCFTECWVEIIDVQVDCDSFLAVATAPGDQNFIWWEIDGEWYQGPTLVLSDLAPGSYDLCAFIETPACPWGAEACTTITIEDCTPCTADLIIDQNDCEAIVTISGAPEDAIYTWEYEGQSFSSEVPSLLIPTEDDGWYSICWSYESESCDGITQGCEEFYADGCASSCFVTFDLDVVDGNLVVLEGVVETNQQNYEAYWLINGEVFPYQDVFTAIVEPCSGNWACLVVEGEGCSTEYCLDFETPCENCNDGELVHIQEGCYNNFQLINVPENTEVLWSLNGAPFEGGISTTLDFLFESSHTISATYTEPGCDEEITLTLDFEVMNCNCEGFYDYSITNDGLLMAKAYAENPLAEFMWFLDDEYVDSGMYIELEIDDCETHNLCLCIISDFCETWWCEEINADQNCNECNDAGLVYTNVGCWYTFDLYNVPENTEVLWTINGISYTDGPNFTADFLQDGWSYVTAQFTEPGCNQPTFLELEVEVFGCGCDGFFDWTYLNDGMIYAQAFSDNPNAQFMWFVNDVPVGDGDGIDIQLETCQDQHVCLCVISELCESWFCEDIFIDEGCNDCTEVSLAMDSFVLQGGPESVYLNLTGPESHYQGFEFSPNEPFEDVDLCLPDGCYDVLIDGAWIENPEAFFSGVYIDGIQVPYTYGPTVNGTVLTYGFSIGDVECADPCSVEIGYETISESEFIFSAYSNGNNQMVSWSVDGVFVEFAEILTLSLDPGEHSICAHHETEACPFGNVVCIDLYVPEQECEEVTFMFNLLEEFDGFAELLLQIEGNGQQILESIAFSDDCTSASVTICLPPGCYWLTCVQEGMDEVPMWFGMHAGNELMFNESGIDLTLDMEFGVASECSNSVNEQEELQVNAYPNPVSDQLNVVLSRWASGTMELFSADGRLILSQRIMGFTQQFDVNGLSAGMYHLRLTDTSNPIKTEVQNVTIVVQR